jgi:hypothetical protein
MASLSMQNEVYAEQRRRAEKRMNPDTRVKATQYAGEVTRRKVRISGTTVVLLDRDKGGAWANDDPDNRWTLLCDEHSCVCGFERQRQARDFMSAPDEWCATCQANVSTEQTDRDRHDLGLDG